MFSRSVRVYDERTEERKRRGEGGQVEKEDRTKEVLKGGDGLTVLQQVDVFSELQKSEEAQEA